MKFLAFCCFSSTSGLQLSHTHMNHEQAMIEQKQLQLRRYPQNSHFPSSLTYGDCWTNFTYKCYDVLDFMTRSYRRFVILWSFNVPNGLFSILMSAVLPFFQTLFLISRFSFCPNPLPRLSPVVPHMLSSFLLFSCLLFKTEEKKKKCKSMHLGHNDLTIVTLNRYYDICPLKYQTQSDNERNQRRKAWKIEKKRRND